MSDQPSVYQALSAVMADVQSVGKDQKNQQQGYQFRGIDAVINAVGPKLRTHGVIVAPVATECHYRDVQTNTGKPSRECTVLVTYRAYGPAGDHLDVQVPGESMDFGDKGAPKAMSVAYRIALLQLLCIPTDEPEPDAATYERAQPPRVISPTDRIWGHANGSDDDARRDWVTAQFESRGLSKDSPADRMKLADELDGIVA